MGEVLSRSMRGNGLTDNQQSKRFQTILESVTDKKGKTRGLLNLAKVKGLSGEAKQQAVNWLMRLRVPIVKEFLMGLDESWVMATGYQYEVTAHNGFIFVCTCENLHTIR